MAKKNKTSKAGKDKSEKITPTRSRARTKKLRVTFLQDQLFRGTYYKKGDSIKLLEVTANAYRSRSTLSIERT